jgi:NAD(P)H-hydrate epimerase
MIVSCREMRAIEERAFADGIAAEALMEEAGTKIAAAVRQFFPAPGKCVVFFGKGHNGGDALVAARHLAKAGWSLDLRPTFPRKDWAKLTEKQRGRIKPLKAKSATSERPIVVLDGLLGIGAGGALREPVLSACREINALRCERNAHVFALDLPTGLDGDAGAPGTDAVVADTTLAIGFAKQGLVADRAIDHVGRLAVLSLAELSGRAGETTPTAAVATAENLSLLLPPRAFDTHKGQCGRVGIVAGSLGTIGAAQLCAEGALRGGAGLVTLYVWREIYPIAASRVAPEVMVKSIDSATQVLKDQQDVLAIGPGVGRGHAQSVVDLVAQAPQPCAVDADALNLLAEHLDALDRCAGPRLLTPHPGEMRRLDAESASRSRRAVVENFISRWPHALLFKSARSLIGQRGWPLSYNSTGHPGLATGGVGDVMTGLCAALAGQRLSLYDAARTAAWLIGRAAEVAIFHRGESAQTLRPTTLLDSLGQAFQDLRANVI